MKYLKLFTIFIFISSCCSSKKLAEKTPEVVKVKDSTEYLKPVKTISETEETTEETKSKNTVNEIIDDKTPEIFNHSNWNTLLQKHVSNQGNVNYKGFKADRKILLNYITSLSENIPNDSWTKEEKLAYWINAYNALTVDLILRHYPVKSIKDIKKPWDQRHWKLGEKWYNLNEIEHEILRKMNEPRIHFAIVCASFSCPKLQNVAFKAESLEQQLENTTKEFINDPKRNSLMPNKIEISKIFAWFDKDFLINGTGSIINYINRYSNIKISKTTTKRFKSYDWSLNE